MWYGQPVAKIKIDFYFFFFLFFLNALVLFFIFLFSHDYFYFFVIFFIETFWHQNGFYYTKKTFQAVDFIISMTRTRIIISRIENSSFRYSSLSCTRDLSLQFTVKALPEKYNFCFFSRNRSNFMSLVWSLTVNWRIFQPLVWTIKKYWK